MSDEDDDYVRNQADYIKRHHCDAANLLIAEGRAAERERCAKIAFNMVAKRDPKFAWEVRAAIRRGECPE